MKLTKETLKICKELHNQKIENRFIFKVGNDIICYDVSAMPIDANRVNTKAERMQRRIHYESKENF